MLWVLPLLISSSLFASEPNDSRCTPLGPDAQSSDPLARNRALEQAITTDSIDYRNDFLFLDYRQAISDQLHQAIQVNLKRPDPAANRIGAQALTMNPSDPSMASLDPAAIPVGDGKLICQLPEFSVQSTSSLASNASQMASLLMVCDYYRLRTDPKPVNCPANPHQACLSFELDVKPAFIANDDDLFSLNAHIRTAMIDPVVRPELQGYINDLVNSFNGPRVNPLLSYHLRGVDLGKRFGDMPMPISGIGLKSVTQAGKNNYEALAADLSTLAPASSNPLEPSAFKVAEELQNPNRVSPLSDQPVAAELNFDVRHIRDLLSFIYKRHYAELERKDARGNQIKCADAEDPSYECELRSKISDWVAQANKTGKGLLHGGIHNIGLDLPVDAYEDIAFSNSEDGNGVDVSFRTPVKMRFRPYGMWLFSVVHVEGYAVFHAKIQIKDWGIRLVEPRVENMIFLKNTNAWVPASLSDRLKNRFTDVMQRATDRLNTVETKLPDGTVVDNFASIEVQINRNLHNTEPDLHHPRTNRDGSPELDENQRPRYYPRIVPEKRGLLVAIPPRPDLAEKFNLRLTIDYVPPACQSTNDHSIDSGWIRIRGAAL